MPSPKKPKKFSATQKQIGRFMGLLNGLGLRKRVYARKLWREKGPPRAIKWLKDEHARRD